MGARVTVGMPVYNGEPHLDAAIASILGQTYDDLVLLISDNASTDGTAAICARHAAADERVRYVRQERNRGYVENFNEVFRRSSTELFAWAAADDLHAPSFLERCIEALDARPEAVLAMSRTAAIDEQGDPVRAELLPGPGKQVHLYGEYSNVEGPEPVDAADAVIRWRRFMQDLWYTLQLYGVIRSSALARTGLHPAHSMGDHILLAELALHGPILEVDEPLFLRRIHERRVTDTASLRQRVATVKGRSHPVGRLSLAAAYAERLRLHAASVGRAPLSAAQQARCHAAIVGSTARWASHRARQLLGRQRN